MLVDISIVLGILFFMLVMATFVIYKIIAWVYKKRKKIKKYIRVAKRTPQFKLDFALGALVTCLFGLVVATSIFWICFYIVLCLVTGYLALKANYQAKKSK